MNETTPSKVIISWLINHVERYGSNSGLRHCPYCKNEMVGGTVHHQPTCEFSEMMMAARKFVAAKPIAGSTSTRRGRR